MRAAAGFCPRPRGRASQPRGVLWWSWVIPTARWTASSSTCDRRGWISSPSVSTSGRRGTTLPSTATSPPRASGGSKRGHATWAFPPCTPGSSCAPPSTPRKWPGGTDSRRGRGRSQGPILETVPAAGGPGRPLRRPPRPLLPEVRPRCRRLGGPGPPPDRPSRSLRGAGLPSRLSDGCYLLPGAPLLDGPGRHPVWRPRPARGHRDHGPALRGGPPLPFPLCALGIALAPGAGAPGAPPVAARLGGHRDPAHAHLLQLSLVPARLQPAPEPPLHSDRGRDRGLRRLLLGGPVLRAPRLPDRGEPPPPTTGGRPRPSPPPGPGLAPGHLCSLPAPPGCGPDARGARPGRQPARANGEPERPHL